MSHRIVTCLLFLFAAGFMRAAEPAFAVGQTWRYETRKGESGFRAYPLHRLEPVLGLWGAQGVVAVVSGLGHYLQGWPSLAAFFGTGLGSLVFGMAAIASRGLALPIGRHAAGNPTDWMLGGKGPTGEGKVVLAEDAQGRSRFVGTLGYCGVMMAATAGFSLWHRHRLPAAAVNLKTS